MKFQPYYKFPPAQMDKLLKAAVLLDNTPYPRVKIYVRLPGNLVKFIFTREWFHGNRECYTYKGAI